MMIGGPELLDLLKADSALLANANAKVGIEEMSLLFTYLKAYNVIPKVVLTQFSPSLSTS